MSSILVQLDYGGRCWPDDGATYAWDSHRVSFRIGGITLYSEFKLTNKEQELLVQTLTDLDPSHPPHWQNIPVELHSTIINLEIQLREATSAVDEHLRMISSAIRLPMYRFPKRLPNQTPNWSTVHWSFNDDEIKRLKPLLEKLDGKKQRAYSKGISIPLPDAFEGRQVYLSKDQIDNFGTAIKNRDLNLPPSNILFGVAWENFEIRSFMSAVIILTASIETALKWYLTQKGDKISGYLIQKTQSPPLAKLVSCARKYAELNVPEQFQKWSANLYKARNEIQHRPVKKNLKPLEIARWFAVGEAILKSIKGEPIHPLVGSKVKISEEIDDFPKGTSGVILRKEKKGDQDSFHIILNSGVTCRFKTETTFEVLNDQSF